MGAVAKSCMRKGFLIYEETRKYLVIYEEAVGHHIWPCNRSRLNFLLYWGKIFILFWCPPVEMLVAGDAGGGGPRQGRGHQVGGVSQDAHQQAEGQSPHQTTINTTYICSSLINSFVFCLFGSALVCYGSSVGANQTSLKNTKLTTYVTLDRIKLF